MNYYKDLDTGKVYAYDDRQVSEGHVREGLISIDRGEVEVILNPSKEPQYRTVFSVLQFRDRFTLEEKIAIRQAQFNDMEVGIVYDEFQAALYIDLEDERVDQGLSLFVQKGLLTEQRKQELLEPEEIDG